MSTNIILLLFLEISAVERHKLSQSIIMFVEGTGMRGLESFFAYMKLYQQQHYLLFFVLKELMVTLKRIPMF